MNTEESRINKVSRRRWLHGAGVLAGLPWLESIPVWGESDDANGASSLPQRFGVLLWHAVYIQIIGGPKVKVKRWS